MTWTETTAEPCSPFLSGQPGHPMGMPNSVHKPSRIYGALSALEAKPKKPVLPVPPHVLPLSLGSPWREESLSLPTLPPQGILEGSLGQESCERKSSFLAGHLLQQLWVRWKLKMWFMSSSIPKPSGPLLVGSVPPSSLGRWLTTVPAKYLCCQPPPVAGPAPQPTPHFLEPSDLPRLSVLWQQHTDLCSPS
jgi:hypothetical protein